jgi:hypothetical protein
LGIGSEPAPVDHFSILVDRAIVAPDISQVNADGYFGWGMSARNFCDEVLRCLFMGNSFCDLEDLLIPFLDSFRVADDPRIGSVTDQ